MKISIISNLYPPHVRGGYELGCADMARELWLQGHEVEVLTSAVAGQLDRAVGYPDGTPVRCLFQPVFDYQDQPSLHRSPAWRLRQSRNLGGVLPGNVIALLAHWDASEPDVVWCFNPLGLGTLGILEAMAYSGRRCVIHHMDDLDRVFAAYSDLTSRFMRAKRHLSAISCSQETRVQNESLGSYREHWVIPNGIKFTDELDRKRTPTQAGTAYRFICFGQIGPEKAVRELLEAFARLKLLRPTSACELHIYGPYVSDAYEAELRRFIRASGLEGSIFLCGSLPKRELLEKLPEFDAAVMLLRESEPFGYAPIEASEAGLPAIFPLAAGSAALLREDRSLLLRERLNPDATASVMARCLDDPAWAREQARLQRRAFREKCDLAGVVLPACLRILEQIPSGPRIAALLSTLLATAQMWEDCSIHRSSRS